MGSWLQHMKSLIFSCGMWGLIPLPRIKLGPPALGVWSLSHWTTREVPRPGTSWRHGNCCIHLCLTLCITHSVLKNIFFTASSRSPSCYPLWLTSCDFEAGLPGTSLFISFGAERDYGWSCNSCSLSNNTLYTSDLVALQNFSDPVFI